MPSPNKSKLIGPSIVAGLILLLYLPSFDWMVNAWIHSDYYSHGFLVPLISAAIVWSQRHHLDFGASNRIGLWLLAASLALYIWGFVYASEFLRAISLLPLLAGIALHFGGYGTLKPLVFPILFLAFMIPLPNINEIAADLQQFSSRMSAHILDWIGIEVTRTGAQLQLANTTLVIGLPCSGLNSLISLTAVAALMAYIVKGSLPLKSILFLAAIPIAILANLLRITTLLLIGYHFGEDAATGVIHDLMSPVFFILSILSLFAILRIIRKFDNALQSTQTNTE